MGHGTFDRAAYATYSTSTVGKKTEELFTSRSISADLNPHGVTMRESRDSDDSPNSTPVIVAVDVTGSMGMLADVIAREGLGTLFNAILDREPISNPHVMFMAFGDAYCDRAPLQVSQFEADNRIVEQLTQIFLEGGGGGNKTESYDFPWYFAANHTVHDSFEKRAKRGYLFTVGDEEAPAGLSQDMIKTFLGEGIQSDVTPEEALKLAQRTYDVFHVVVEEGSYASHRPNEVLQSWQALLGQHVIQLSDHKALAETIVSAIEVAEGRDAAESAARWGDRSKAVERAVKDLPVSKRPAALAAPEA